MQVIEVRNIDELDTIIGEINNDRVKYVSLDCETDGLNRLHNRLLSFTFSPAGSGIVYYCSGELAKGLQRLKRPVTLHNYKFDFHVFLRHGVDLRNTFLFADTLILDHLLDENNSHALDDIIQRRYQDNYKEVFWGKYKEFTDAPKEEQMEYSCKDAYYTDLVCEDTFLDLQKEGVPYSLITHVHELALALFDTEVRGLKLDLPYLSKVGDDLSVKITGLTAKMRETVDLECQILENEAYEKELDKRKTPKGKLGVKRPSFNWDSPTQLNNLIYDHLGLSKQYKDGKLTVNDAALERLESEHAVIPLLRDYRGHQKVFGSFIEGSLKQSHNGRIYPSFNPCGTVTGRISSSEPNLQQLPSSGGIRGIYVPEENHVFISADYSQLEVTLAAHYSRDGNILSIIYDGKSQHDITAAGLGIPRNVAKTVNFALQYGAGPRKLEKILGCSPKEAESAYNRYWETYSGLRDFISRCHREIEQGRPLINPFGRRRRFKSFDQVKAENPGSWFDRKTGENVPRWRGPWEAILRQGPNSLIQGAGADCTNVSFHRVNKLLRSKGFGYALFVVHDEVLISVNKEFVDESRKILQAEMEGIGNEIELTVPLKVEVSPPMLRWED